MRGLLFTGGIRPDMDKAYPFFTPYSFVVAADSGLCGCELAGIVPDIIVGDMDSIPDPQMLKKYASEKIHVWPKDKDCTDTELALTLMAEKGVDEVILIGGSGGRLDHFFALRLLFDGTFPPAMWIGEESVVISIGGNTLGCGIHVTGLNERDTVSVFTAGRGIHSCKGNGFHWDVDSLEWNAGAYSLSNRADFDSVTLETLSGRFLLVIPLRTGISLKRF